MVKLGIEDLDKIISPYKIVEFEADWANHIVELADIIWRLARQGEVHIVFLNSSKYVDVNKLYMDLEPLIEDVGDVKVYWTRNMEILAYHLLLLTKTKNGSVVIILPYRRDLISQIENTYVPKLRYALKIAADNGWNIVIVNPVVTDSIVSNYIGDITLRIRFGEEANYIEVLNKALINKSIRIFKQLL